VRRLDFDSNQRGGVNRLLVILSSCRTINSGKISVEANSGGRTIFCSALVGASLDEANARRTARSFTSSTTMRRHAKSLAFLLEVAGVLVNPYDSTIVVLETRPIGDGGRIVTDVKMGG
jgi:hypothetical protein